MYGHGYVCVLLLGFNLFGRLARVSACRQEPETPDWRMTLKTIRNGIHRIDTYLNAALDLFGGDDGLCHYRCSDGELALSISCWRHARVRRIVCTTLNRRVSVAVYKLLLIHTLLLQVTNPCLAPGTSTRRPTDVAPRSLAFR